MKQLNEYKAEIFRRSEIRIRNRKKMRNRIIACCIPLCLAIFGIFAYSLLPNAERQTDGEDTLLAESINSSSAPDSNKDQGTKAEFVLFKVEEKNGKYSFTNDKDPERISALFTVVDSVFESPKPDIPDSEPPNRYECFFKYPSDNCTLTFTDKNGEQTAYFVDNNVITNLATGVSVVMTEEQHLKFLEQYRALTAIVIDMEESK